MTSGGSVGWVLVIGSVPTEILPTFLLSLLHMLVTASFHRDELIDMSDRKDEEKRGDMVEFDGAGHVVPGSWREMLVVSGRWTV